MPVNAVAVVDHNPPGIVLLHWTPLVCSVRALSPCVRQSIAPSAFPQPAPGAALSPRPLQGLAEQWYQVLGMRDVHAVQGKQSLALVEAPRGELGERAGTTVRSTALATTAWWTAGRRCSGGPSGGHGAPVRAHPLGSLADRPSRWPGRPGAAHSGTCPGQRCRVS